MVLVNILILLVSFILLVKGADHFVKSSASIAKRFGVSSFVIGLTLIALGTSLPELISSIIASAKHESGLVIGTILGANIANLTFVIGISSLVGLIKTNKIMVERDSYMVLFIAVSLVLFLLDGALSRVEGGVLLLLFVAYTFFVLEPKKRIKSKHHFRGFLNYFIEFGYITTIKEEIYETFNHHEKRIATKKMERKKITKDVIVFILSGVLLVIGAKYLVDQAVFFTNFFHVSETFIGILMAIGTTIPELTVGITAARKGYGNIVIGNSFGSCITNILLILGIASLISPIAVTRSTIFFTAPSLILISSLAFLFVRTKRKVTKLEGLILSAVYLLFLVLAFYITRTS